MEALGCQKSFRGQVLGDMEERPEVLGTLRGNSVTYTDTIN